jgi:hypothetical protein
VERLFGKQDVPRDLQYEKGPDTIENEKDKNQDHDDVVEGIVPKEG